MPEERKPQSADKYIVRFPDGMRDKIAEAAKANNRTMNAEIVARLEVSFAGVLPATTPDAAMSALADRLEKQDRAIASLTNLAYTMAVLSNSKDIGGLDKTAGALKALLEDPQGRKQFDQLIEQFNENVQKTEKSSKRMARFKKAADH